MFLHFYFHCVGTFNWGRQCDNKRTKNLVYIIIFYLYFILFCFHKYKLIYVLKKKDNGNQLAIFKINWLILLEVFKRWCYILLPLAKDHSSEEKKYQVFLEPWINSRSQDANTNVKGNESHLTELVFDE